MTGSERVRVVLYVRSGCRLCDAARTVVAGVAAQSGARWEEVDVDAAATHDGGLLRDRYGEEVPVVTVDGILRGMLRIDADRLRTALSAPPPAP